MKRGRIFLLLCIITALVCCASFALPCFAKGEAETTTANAAEEAASKGAQKRAAYLTPGSGIISIAKNGDITLYPENSAEGIKSAVKKGVDIVEVDVRKTADDVYILLKDEDFTRMCADPSGNTVTSKIAESESWEVIGMLLRAGHGGEGAKVTEYHPCTLDDAIKIVGSDALLLINFDWDMRDDIYNKIYELNAFDSVIFKANASKGAISRFIKDKANERLLVMGVYSSNVVFSVRSFVKKTVSNGVYANMLGTKNTYGVIFHQSVLSLFKEQGRAAIDMTDKNLCGGRDDDETGWNDVAARGYSIIATDYPDRLVSYVKSVEKEKTALKTAVENARNSDLSAYSEAEMKKLNKTLEECDSLIAFGSSKKGLNEKYYELSQLVMQLEAGEFSQGKTVTAGRITAAVLISLLFIFSQIIVYRHSKKRPDKKKA